MTIWSDLWKNKVDPSSIDHNLLNNLDYSSAGHTGFQPSLGYTPANSLIEILGAGLLSGQGGDLTSNRTFTLNNIDIDHDALTNFLANEHIDWTNTSENLNTTGSVTAGSFVSIGPEELSDPGFDTPGDWTTGTFWSITGSQAVHFGPPSAMTESSPFTVVADRVYKVVMDKAISCLINITIGGVTASSPSSDGTGEITLYVKAGDSSSLSIDSVGDAQLNSLSIKALSNGEFGDLTAGGDLYAGELVSAKMTLNGLPGVSNIGGTGGDAADVITVLGGDGGLGDDSGDGSGVSYDLGDSPACLGTRGNGGGFEVATGDGGYGGIIDLDTGSSEYTMYGSRGIMKLNKSGGRIAIGGDYNPTAKLHIASPIALTSGNAPLKLTDSGIGLLSTIEEGAVEFDNNVLYFSRSASLRNPFVFGAGVAFRIPYWNSGNNALITDTGFSYDTATQRLDVAAGYKVQSVKVVGTQEPSISDPSGGSTIDSEARTAIGLMLTAMRNHGLIST